MNTLRNGAYMNIPFLLKPKSKIAYLYDFNTIRQGLEKIKNHGFTAIPVIGKDGSYIGTVSEGDFLWHLVGHDSGEMKEQEEYSILDIVRLDWNPAVKISETMDELLLRVMEQNFVPVVDDRNLFMGIITRKDVIKFFYDEHQENRNE